MSDIGLLFITTLAIVTVSVLLSHWIVARKPGWRSGKIAWLSALPVPLMAWVLALYIVVRAMTASAEQCGVDACGMAMAGAVMIALSAVVIYLVSAIIVFLIVKRHRA